MDYGLYVAHEIASITFNKGYHTFSQVPRSGTLNFTNHSLDFSSRFLYVNPYAILTKVLSASCYRRLIKFEGLILYICKSAKPHAIASSAIAIKFLMLLFVIITLPKLFQQMCHQSNRSKRSSPAGSCCYSLMVMQLQ